MMRAGVFALALFVTPFVAGASTIFSDIDDVPGVDAGEGTSFRVTDSGYLDVGIESSEPIRMRLESMPNIITMRLEPLSPDATSTEMRMTGLAPDTAYFKYEDNYHNLARIVSDGSGEYSYEQDLSKPHLIFIQPKKSTKFLINDATGGDCASVGTWDAASGTCTLTSDLNETMEIDSDGVTLDGAGHISTGANTGNGIYLDGRTGVTIKNLRIRDFYFGIDLNGSSDIHIEDNVFEDTNQAVVLGASNANFLMHNAVSLLDPSSIRHQGFVLYGSSDNTFENNAISLGTKLATGRHQGILLFDSDRNAILSNTVSDTYQGVLLFGSHDNVVRDNLVQESVKEGLAIFTPTGGNQIFHNNFIDNGAPPVDYGSGTDSFSKVLPDGGNYWSTFADCTDGNLDGLCDSAYVFYSNQTGQDDLPWATKDGWKNPPPPPPSNVLFLPGIEGSRLYEGTSCGNDAEEKLWDPLDDSVIRMLRGAGDAKVKRLTLDGTGRSICSDIYAKEGDVMDSVHGSNIYQSFIEEMNGLKQNGTITDWEPVAYDWRLSLDDLLSNGAERDGKIYYEEASSTPYIEQSLRSLSATSRSGKVTIVAHSNGGLIAKALLNKLGDTEAAKLVDRVIMVGVPQSGAPADIGAMLVGYDAGIYTYGFPIVSNAAARALVQNSPMGYHLLPSTTYLESVASDVAHPVIHFSGSAYATEINAYGSSITDGATLDDFLLAKEGGRIKPKAGDVNSAEILNPALINYANSMHATLDAWAPPSGIELDQVTGWGVDTVAGVDFYTASTSVLSFLGSKSRYRPTFIEDGDGTVPVPSALMTASSTNVKRYWIDLNLYYKTTQIKRKHGDIFEIPSLEDFIKNIIQNGTSTVPAYISASQPPSIVANKKLAFFLHAAPAHNTATTTDPVKSPVKVRMRAKQPSGRISGLQEDDSTIEDIPNSTYGEFGDTQYLILPGDSPYELSISGQESEWTSGGSGGATFTLDIQESTDEVVTSSTSIADVPVTASTTAVLSIPEEGMGTSTPLVVDENGDGEDDITITPVVGETVNYEPPAASDSGDEPAPIAEADVAPIPLARAAGGPGYSPYLPLITTPSTTGIESLAPGISTTSIAIASSTTSTTTWPKPKARKTAARIPTPDRSTSIAPTVPPIAPQFAAVYMASQQSILSRLEKEVYNRLHGLLFFLRNFF